MDGEVRRAVEILVFREGRRSLESLRVVLGRGILDGVVKE